eukprot:CFRG8349T1
MKLKVLCIHGFGQTSENFRAKSGSFRQIMKNKCEFVFIQAPHVIRPSTQGEGLFTVDICESDVEGNIPIVNDLGMGMAWWSSDRRERKLVDWDPLAPPLEDERLAGLETSIQHANNVFKEEGPFNGCLGFSQGAAFLSVLSAVAARNRRSALASTADTGENGSSIDRVPKTLGLDIDFNFGVFISGFFPREISVRSYLKHYTKASDTSINTIHIYGKSDDIIPSIMSVDLYNHFAMAHNPLSTHCIVHEGGHYVPHDKRVKHELRAALNSYENT